MALIPDNAPNRIRNFAAVALLAVSQAGCWEEIRYEPKPERVQSSADVGAPEVPATDGPGDHAEPANPPPRAAQAPPLETPPLDLASETPLTEPSSDEPPPALPEVADPNLTTADDAPAEQSSSGIGDLFPRDEPEMPVATPADRRLLWQAASKWSLAAGMLAKNLPANRFEPVLKEAKAAAEELDLALPPLPGGDAAPPAMPIEQAVIAELEGAPADELIAAAAQRYGDSAGGLVELAIRSNLLLLTYSPRRSDVAALAGEVAAAAESSRLPPELWRPLAELLDQRTDYVEVRSAIFELHRAVDAHFASTAP